ncbi:MAG: hypothetical protein HFP77_09085 [Methylococcales symbiont of Iophon sp. n. MRB-2018]|nr:MAG: hypothetical protein HFP77_09085 [Methylococcales symbiont of Iophon sp. n. MRB-2018]KAF3978903.1 MAG: hypothetical protein HFP76_10540 [Methylococcales symbiont of Iophon sp. n. MRB-2018]
MRSTHQNYYGSGVWVEIVPDNLTAFPSSLVGKRTLLLIIFLDFQNLNNPIFN